jgi:hypothetical protein
MNKINKIAFIFALIHFIYYVFSYFDASILSVHGFRQSQTAISSLFYIKEGYSIFNKVPVISPNWLIPFEMPLYQLFVAFITEITGLGLIQTGRFIGALAYIIGTFSLYLSTNISKSFKLENKLLYPFLFCVSPIYIFWSRAFLIESSAFMFSALFLFFSLKYLSDSKNKFLLIALILGILAGLVKITTLFSFTSILCIEIFLLKKKDFPQNFKSLTPLILLLTIPVIIFRIWTYFADQVKAESVFKFFLSYEMNKWNFGTLEQRFDLEIIKRIYQYSGFNLTGGKIFIILIVALFIFNYKQWKKNSIILMLYLSPILIFLNLFYRHDYYQYSIGYIIIYYFAFNLDLILLKKEKGFKLISYVLLLIVTFKSHLNYKRYYLKKQKVIHTKYHQPAQFLKSILKQDEIFYYIGDSWSPALAFKTESYCMMDPDMELRNEKELKLALDSLKKKKIKALVVIGEERFNQDEIRHLIKVLNLSNKTKVIEPFKIYY